MKAIFLKKYGQAEQAFETKEANKPTIQQTNDVLIKVESFGLNYADVMARNGQYKEAPPIPCVLGYEVVGTVEEVGDKKDAHWIGKRVVSFTRFGGYAEYALTKTEGLTEIEDMDDGIALSIATQYATAYYMAYIATNLFPGDKVLIHAAAGGVGTALIQLCKLKGCVVIANAGNSEKIEYVKKQGADYAINYREKDYIEEVNKILNNEKVDCIFNPIAGSTFKKDFSILAHGGRIILFGGSELSGKKWGILSGLNFVRKMGFRLSIGLMMASKSIIGVNMLKIGDHKPHLLKKCLDDVIKMVKEGKLKPHVGGVYSVKEIAEAHTFLESRKSIGKIVVNWN